MMQVFYDGSCPFCRHEVAWLKKRTPFEKVQYQDLCLVDENSPVCGLDRQTLMQEIHAVDEDGRILKGMEVIRRMYREAGMSWLLLPTAWPILKPVFDTAYRLFAKHRLRLGRVFGSP